MISNIEATEILGRHGLTQTAWKGAFPGVSFGATIQFLGMKNITIGNGTCIGDCSWLNVCIRDEEIRMRIGAYVLVGRQAVISTGGILEIGDYCVFAPHVYISDADHIYADITQPIVQQGATFNRCVVVEVNCWLGVNTVIAGNLTVGRDSVIGANAVVTRDVHPFSVAVGNPAQIIKCTPPELAPGKEPVQKKIFSVSWWNVVFSVYLHVKSINVFSARMLACPD